MKQQRPETPGGGAGGDLPSGYNPSVPPPEPSPQRGAAPWYVRVGKTVGTWIAKNPWSAAVVLFFLIAAFVSLCHGR